MIEMPEIARTDEVRTFLRVDSASTFYKWMSGKKFKPGIYLGYGRFNMSRLKQCIENEGRFLKRLKKGKR